MRRRLRQARAVARLFRAAGTLVRARGLYAVLNAARRHLADGSGPRGLLLWMRDAAAYERRGDQRLYANWLKRRRARIDVSLGGNPPEGSLAVVPVPRDLRLRLSSISGCGSRFVCVLHEDCSLAPGAFAAMVEAADRTGADVVYTDEDHCGERCHSQPRFKPGFSIDLLRSVDYIGPVFLLRSAAVRRMGEPEADEMCPYELLLRLYEAGARFARVAEVLVHWRQHRSTLLTAPQRHVVAQHLVRCYGEDLGRAMLPEAVAERARVNSDNRVSIIIPTKDRVSLLSTCVESIYRSAFDVRFEVIILDNGSTDPATRGWLIEAPSRFARLRVAEADYAFNWSRLNNQGVRLATGNLLLFLNNDVEALGDGWLDELAIQASRPDVGAVGALLLYPEGTIQHAGVVVGMGGFADHVYAGCPEQPPWGHVFVDPLVPRNVLACTGACLMISRDRLAEIGGFNEDLEICGDIDICLRLHRRGYLNLYDPRARLYHHESATRTRRPLSQREVSRTLPIFEEFIRDGDPYYNPNLALSLRYPLFQVDD